MDLTVRAPHAGDFTALSSPSEQCVVRACHGTQDLNCHLSLGPCPHCCSVVLDPEMGRQLSKVTTPMFTQQRSLVWGHLDQKWPFLRNCPCKISTLCWSSWPSTQYMDRKGKPGSC
jgi:hypothetical protein